MVAVIRKELVPMSIPKPGNPVRGSKTGAPIMALFDLLGRHWAMGIVWNLSKGGPMTFRTLQSSCERKSGSISPSILNKRIKDLQEAKLVERTLQGYALTKQGEELFDLLEPFDAWSKKWAKEVSANSTR
jgi:DNA-binding HxlR family transcriptional regulator